MHSLVDGRIHVRLWTLSGPLGLEYPCLAPLHVKESSKDVNSRQNYFEE